MTMLHVDDSAPTAVLSLAHGKVNALDVELLEAVADRLAAPRHRSARRSS